MTTGIRRGVEVATGPAGGAERAGAAVRPRSGRAASRWWAELLLIALVYAAYSGGRLLARGDVAAAVSHGRAILGLEEPLGLDLERLLNPVFTDHAWLGVPADFAYASLHYLVTPAVLVWLYLRRPAHYRAARRWLMASTLMGLVGFALLPTSPPRLLGAGSGFADTMARFSTYGWWGAEASAPRGLGSLTNQYAAMPSLHVGWALWCGILLWRHGRTPLVRAAGAAYPVLTALVVMGTANHYFLDAAAGCAVMGLGYLVGVVGADALTRAVARRRAGDSGPVPVGSVPGARAAVAEGPRAAVAEGPRAAVAEGPRAAAGGHRSTGRTGRSATIRAPRSETPAARPQAPATGPVSRTARPEAPAPGAWARAPRPDAPFARPQAPAPRPDAPFARPQAPAPRSAVPVGTPRPPAPRPSAPGAGPQPSGPPARPPATRPQAPAVRLGDALGGG